MHIAFEGRTALVTGASRGIGLAIARRFAESGANVMITSRHADGLADAAASMKGLSGRVAWFVAHAGQPEDAERCIGAVLEEFGALDVLVNNAATNPHHGEVLDIEQGQAEKTLQVNLLGALAWTRAAYRAALHGGGSILNVASVGGIEPEPGIGWYNVTKAALLHLTRQLAFELAPEVRVNAVAPGLVHTGFSRVLWEGRESSIEARIPLHRIGTPDDVAGAALFLCSDAASWITGHVLVVDGGALCVPSGAVG